MLDDLNQCTALEVNGEPLSLAEALRLASWREQLGFLREAADGVLIRQQAAQRGIEITGAELQQTADAFRARRSLSTAAALEQWLVARHLTSTVWEQLLEQELILHKLREAVTAAQVEPYFAGHKFTFDAATISHLLVNNEGAARELRAQICEEGADFHKLARAYSLDTATRLASGYVGRVRRSDLPGEAAVAVFSAQPGRIVGPFKTDEGWRLIRVHALHPATLDDETREEIKALLFVEWLDERRRKARINTPVLTMLGRDANEVKHES